MRTPVMVYNTRLPEELCDLFLQQAKDIELEQSKIGYFHNQEINEKTRNSKVGWIGQEHWLGGFLWNYIWMANESNYGYDILGLDYQKYQYSEYGVDGHYSWHVDAQEPDPNTPFKAVRKLSLTLQLSREDEYTGGELEFSNDFNQTTFTTPKDYGVLTIFDSRTLHRVKPVTSGLRKSIVGWIVGPPWK